MTLVELNPLLLIALTLALGLIGLIGRRTGRRELVRVGAVDAGRLPRRAKSSMHSTW